MRPIPIIPVPNLISQPDGYSCGPTAVAMALDLLGYTYTVPELKGPFQVSPVTGTTHEGMISGFDHLGIPYVRSEGWKGGVDHPDDLNPFSQLDQYLSLNKLFLMRTLFFGVKHWILVYGKSPEGKYLIADPMGRFIKMSKEDVRYIWESRDYDGFYIDQTINSEVTLELLKETEIVEAIRVGHKSFREIIHMSALGFEYLISSSASFPISWVAKHREKIVGGYFLGENQLYTTRTKYKKGVQGVGLFVLPEYRDLGIGAALRDIPLYLPYDYIWGMHLKELNNIDNWKRYGREVLAGEGEIFTTMMDLTEKRKQRGLEELSVS